MDDTLTPEQAAAARLLDADLLAWAIAPVASDDAMASRAADAALAVLPAPRRWWPALTGGAIAATLAAIAVIPRTGTGPVPVPAPAVQIAAAAPTAAEAQITSDAAVLALVFTSTPEEESLL